MQQPSKFDNILYTKSKYHTDQTDIKYEEAFCCRIKASHANTLKPLVSGGLHQFLISTD